MLSILTAIGLFALAGAILGRAWNTGWWAVAVTLILVLGFSVLPWVYTLSAVLWVDPEHVAYDRLLVLHTLAPRSKVTRVVGDTGRILFIGEGKVLLSTLRYWSDDQIRAMAAQLGVKVEGGARRFGRL